MSDLKEPETLKEEHEDLGVRFNGRVSYLCVLISLIIGIIVLATAAVGDLDYHRAFIGVSLSIVLLSLAFLQQYRDSRKKPRS